MELDATDAQVDVSHQEQERILWLGFFRGTENRIDSFSFGVQDGFWGEESVHENTLELRAKVSKDL